MAPFPSSDLQWTVLVFTCIISSTNTNPKGYEERTIPNRKYHYAIPHLNHDIVGEYDIFDTLDVRSTTTTTMTSTTTTVHDVGMLVDPCPYAVAGDRTHVSRSEDCHQSAGLCRLIIMVKKGENYFTINRMAMVSSFSFCCVMSLLP